MLLTCQKYLTLKLHYLLMIQHTCLILANKNIDILEKWLTRKLIKSTVGCVIISYH